MAPEVREVATIGESPSLPNYLGMKMRVHISPVNRNALSQAVGSRAFSRVLLLLFAELEQAGVRPSGFAKSPVGGTSKKWE